MDAVKDDVRLKTRDEKISGKPEYTGRILAVGIAYDKNDPQKRHECKVEVLREKL